MSRFRNRDRSNRQGRGQIEHNVLEGLPINQYREIEVTVGPNAADNKPIDANAWPELPMPRDSHMLAEHSQQLLRAARSGRTIQLPAPPEDDDTELKDEEPEQKQVPVGFTVKKYVKVARHNEAPEPEYLAKRRKGLPSQYLNGQVQGPLREIKVKKLDAEGNVAVYKVLAPEGQAVEGEVAPTDAAIEVAPVIAAPGTVVEGVGVVNAEGIVVANDILQQTPPRRRPPPPKKKKTKHIPRGGPGRGRKKVDFAEGAEGQGVPVPNADGVLPAIRDLKEGEGGSVEPSDRDTPMGEAGEEDESGEEGSEDDEQDQEEGTPAAPSRAASAAASAPVVEMTDAPDVAGPTVPVTVTEDTPATPPKALQPAVGEVQSAPTSLPQPVQPTETTKITEPAPPPAARDRSSSPELPLADHSRQNSTTQVPTSITTVEPVAFEPTPAKPALADAKLSEPAPSEPAPSEPTAPELTAPEPTAPEPTAPEPTASEPTASEPTASEPTASEPTASEPTASEPTASEPTVYELIPAPIPSTETGSVPASVDIPAGEPVDNSVSVPEPEIAKVPSPEQPLTEPLEDASAGNTPDLLGSLEAELDRE